MKRSREEKGGKKKKEETINFKFFPVVRYLESYMYVIIFCIRLLSMEGSIGCQITRGYQQRGYNLQELVIHRLIQEGNHYHTGTGWALIKNVCFKAIHLQRRYIV